MPPASAAAQARAAATAVPTGTNSFDSRINSRAANKSGLKHRFVAGNVIRFDFAAFSSECGEENVSKQQTRRFSETLLVVYRSVDCDVAFVVGYWRT
jgi:hypothetical protein